MSTVSVIYLVYDRFYEMEVSISVTASDPADPFKYPFVIVNNSHVFTIRNVVWRCMVVRYRSAAIGLEADRNKIVAKGQVSAMAPGKSLNLPCSYIGPNARFVQITPAPKADEAVVQLDVVYDVDVFGFWTRQMSAGPALFTWYAAASNPQWVKGDFVK